MKKYINIKKCIPDSEKIISKGSKGYVFETSDKDIVVKATTLKKEVFYAKKASKLTIGPTVYKTTKKCGYYLIYMKKVDMTLNKWLRKKHSLKTYERVYKKLIELVEKLHKNNLSHNDIHVGNIGLVNKKWVLIDFGNTTRLNGNFSKKINFLKLHPLYSNKGYEEYFKKVLVPYNKLPLNIKIHIFYIENLKGMLS